MISKGNRLRWRAGYIRPKTALDFDEAHGAKQFDGLLLAGGGDVDASLFGQVNHPLAKPVPWERDITEMRLTEFFLIEEKPILAICRGIQMLNISLGGDLIQHIGDIPGAYEHAGKQMRHGITLDKSLLLGEIFPGKDTLLVNSTHHQALGRLGDGLTVCARSLDGIIEAVCAKNVLGVQFHPERLLNEGMGPIWEWFARRCWRKE